MQSHSIHHVTVDSEGGILLPQEVRKRHGLTEGAIVILAQTEFGLSLRRLDSVTDESRPE